MKNKCESEMNDMELVDPYDAKYVLNEKLPQSSIVFDNQLSERSKIRTLIRKYAKTSATYEINIPYGMRMYYMSLLEESGSITGNNVSISPLDMMSSNDLVFVFDPILQELSGLMRSAYSRFAITAAFINM